MIELLGSRITRRELHLCGYGAVRQAFMDRTPVSRIIGTTVIMLLLGSSALGQIIVQPMRMELALRPGKRHWRELILENTSQFATQQVDLRIIDMAQDPNGIYTPIEPDDPITEGPNNTRWVTVDLDGEEGNAALRLDITKLRSCASWLYLPQDTVTLDPWQRVSLRLRVEVPPGRRGYYCAAIVARTVIGLLEDEEEDSPTTTVIFEFMVPVIIEVEGRTVRHEIGLKDVGLEFREQTESRDAATLVTLAIDNDGVTYSRLNCFARIWGQWGGHWRKLTDVEFIETGIIPGAKLNLKQDVGRALPSAKYKVEGYLVVDGFRADQLSGQLDFQGDDRVRSVKADAALDLDPAEIFIETVPGASRMGTVTVANASEEAVDVTVELAIPEHLVGTVRDSVRGETFGCAGWLDVSPQRFKLAGHGRKNLRLMANMPESGALQPNSYALVKLHSTYADGQSGGTRKARVCVQNKRSSGTPNVRDILLTLKEAAPGRYLVTSRFGNYGDTHVLPYCRAVLTTFEGNSLRKRLNLSSQVYEQSGMMLPWETRNFAGILDLADVSPGRYRLTAIMSHDKGGAVQRQIVLQVSNAGEHKTANILTDQDYEPVTIAL